MTQRSDQQLLRDYARGGDEAAFSELVGRHADFVFSAALRTARDRQRAEDVAQAVFIALARDAERLSERDLLEGWLHRTAHHIAAQSIRTDTRRRVREEKAMATGNPSTPDSESVDWDLVSRHVDEAVGELAETDRQAVLLRYFQKQTAREMALQFGTSEEAAQKRVARAVERLREQLARRGISVAAGGLANGLSSLALEPAPAGLVSSLIREGFASGPVSAAATTQFPLTGPTLLSMTTVQKSLAAALLLLTTGTALLQFREATGLRSDLEKLRTARTEESADRARISLELEDLRAQAGRMSQEISQARQDHLELLRLRGEVGVLREERRTWKTTAARPAPAQPGQPSRTPAPPPPFQLRWVADESTEGAEVLPPPEGSGPANGPGETVRVAPATLLDHTAVQSAEVQLDPNSGNPRIEVLFTDQGREAFAKLTRENLNRRLAIAIDGRLYAAPVIRSEISEGKAVISGSFTEEQAWQLAAKINLALGSP